MIDFSEMSEAHVKACAAEQAMLTVRQLRQFGWMFAAVLVYARKHPRGLAGASFFDWPLVHIGYAGPLVAAAQALVRDMEQGAARHGVSTEDASGTNFHMIGGSPVEETKLLAHMRDVADDVLEAVGKREADLGALALACQAEQRRRKVARVTGAPTW
jgi:hypothetical protein